MRRTMSKKDGMLPHLHSHYPPQPAHCGPIFGVVNNALGGIARGALWASAQLEVHIIKLNVMEPN